MLSSSFVPLYRLVLLDPISQLSQGFWSMLRINRRRPVLHDSILLEDHQHRSNRIWSRGGMDECEDVSEIPRQFRLSHVLETRCIEGTVAHPAPPSSDLHFARPPTITTNTPAHGCPLMMR